MSHPTESPGTPVPNSAPDVAPAPAPQVPDVARQIADLTEAVNRLVQAQQAPRASSAAHDIGGEIPGGEALVPAVDYSKLSPLQQITLGLRDAKPVGPERPAVVSSRDAAAATDAAPQGAD